MKVLITGITGFVGSHLAEYCIDKGCEVYGIKRWRSNMENIEGLKVELIECDIRDAASVRSAIEDIKPDQIYHLAAQSYVPASWSAPSETLSTNILGELNIFEAVKNIENYSPRILVAGSSEEYGFVKESEVPIKETNPLRPLSPYGVSKVTQDMLAYQYNKSFGLDVVRTRAFNHTGPRRGEVFVCSNFAKQIVDIEKNGDKPFLYVGNLEAKRDFTDVRDMVNAYWLALEHCEGGEVYNICSGTEGTYAIDSILEKLVEKSTTKITVRQDPKRMRPSDVPILCGDSTKFREKTGWKPTIKIDKTLNDILEYWRNK